MNICSIDDCGKKHYGNGWCNTHYTRWRRNGDPLVNKKPKTPAEERSKICSQDDCERKNQGRSLCGMHWARWKRHGDPTFVTKRTNNPSIDGYIRIRVSGKAMVQHRHIMEQHLGRKLLSEENVHHINGNRSDNRIENLEIWDTRQPKGQRVSDKIEYALEILEHYAPDLLKEKKCQQDQVG